MFVNFNLDKIIYLKPPQDVEIEPCNMLEMVKFLYNLKQSAYLWNKKIIEFVVTIGF